MCWPFLLAKIKLPPGWERKILDGSQIFMAHNAQTRAQTPDDDARHPMFYHYTTSLCDPCIHISA